jgi:hypothetical protein
MLKSFAGARSVASAALPKLDFSVHRLHQGRTSRKICDIFVWYHVFLSKDILSKDILSNNVLSKVISSNNVLSKKILSNDGSSNDVLAKNHFCQNPSSSKMQKVILGLFDLT